MNKVSNDFINLQLGGTYLFLTCYKSCGELLNFIMSGRQWLWKP